MDYSSFSLRIQDPPIKDRDHAMDPIRYMVMKLDQGRRGGGLAITGWTLNV